MKKAKVSKPNSAPPHPRDPTAADTNLGSTIRARRIEIGMSQATLGETLGVSFQQVQKYEKGFNRVGAARLQQIAKALEVPVDHFYGREQQSNLADSIIHGASKDSVRMLRAFAKIQDQALQRQMVFLAEAIAVRYDN